MVDKESKRRAKILTIDIETSPLVAYSWGPIWETNLIEIIEQGQIICYSAKWLGGKQTTKALPDYKGYKKGVIDDKNLVADIHDLFEEADIIVGHNSNKFDIKYVNSRLLYHGYKPPSPNKSIDTCTSARTIMKLPSYKLNDVAQYLGLGKKVQHTGFSLWKECLEGVSSAWKKMKQYNKQDTKLTESVYLKLRPYIKNHPNLGMSTETVCCPKCNGEDYQWRGYAKTSASVFKRFQCNDCGGWGRSAIRDHGYVTGRNV